MLEMEGKETVREEKKKERHFLSRPRSRSDPIGESEPVSGCETIYWDFFFFFFSLTYTCGYTNNFYNNQQSFTFSNELPPKWYPLKFIHIY